MLDLWAIQLVVLQHKAHTPSVSLNHWMTHKTALHVGLTGRILHCKLQHWQFSTLKGSYSVQYWTSSSDPRLFQDDSTDASVSIVHHMAIKSFHVDIQQSDTTDNTKTLCHKHHWLYSKCTSIFCCRYVRSWRTHSISMYAMLSHLIAFPHSVDKVSFQYLFLTSWFELFPSISCWSSLGCSKWFQAPTFVSLKHLHKVCNCPILYHVYLPSNTLFQTSFETGRHGVSEIERFTESETSRLDNHVLSFTVSCFQGNNAG